MLTSRPAGLIYASRLLMPAARRGDPMVKFSREQSRKLMIARQDEAVHGKASPMRKPASLTRISMSFSLDTPSALSLKAEAKALREERAIAGTPLSQGAALEEVARRHGYRDWNTASAALPERVVTPFQVGQRVKGSYLGKPYVGLVIGVKLLANMQNYEITVKFDHPVNVSKFASMVHNRQRVTSTIDLRGTSLAHTGNGEPQMRVMRA
jgi:hypothetical protein